MSGFDGEFLSAAEVATQAYSQAIQHASQIVLRDLASLGAPYRGPAATELARRIGEIDVCPEEGEGLEATLDLVGRAVLRHSVNVADPACLGHLHCPPLIPALAAETAIAAANQSMDSWDQAPAATYVEQRMVSWLCRLLGLGDAADGIFTSGGTQSNLMGLLLARDLYARRRLDWSIQRRGLPPDAVDFRILCSENAHFSVRQAAAILGLGQNSVVTVPVDDGQRMDAAAAARTIERLERDGLRPIAITATAGTTDCGAIDPLPALADLARRHDLWLHVDAAYAGALALSDRFKTMLDGIALADSVTFDFHKLLYQPISCGAFLVRDRAAFEVIRLHADYLNPEENQEADVIDLVTKSIQTTRRFDGLKPFVTLRALGRRRLAAMIEHTIDVARAAATLITADPDLELAVPPAINCLLLRFRPPGTADLALDAANAAVQQKLLHGGHALLSRTRFKDRVFLKITLLNPRTTPDHVATILDRIKTLGREALARA